MATKIIESEGDAEFSPSQSALATRLDNAMLALEQKEEEFASYLREIKDREAEIKQLREKLLEAMDEQGVKKLETKRLVISAVHPKPSQRIDTALLRTINPMLFKQAFEVAGKQVENGGYVKITVKSNK